MSRRQSATTIVSFALIAPMFFFMIFGITEGARIFNAYVTITNEAREAARYGAVHFDGTQPEAAQETAISAYLSQRLNGLLSADGLKPAPRVHVDMTTSKVDVTVSYQVQLIIPMIASFLPNPFPIQARSIMIGEPDN